MVSSFKFLGKIRFFTGEAWVLVALLNPIFFRGTMGSKSNSRFAKFPVMTSSDDLHVLLDDFDLKINKFGE
jgi:hypothetical protein